MLKTQLQQVMEQICCEKVGDFCDHLFQSQEDSRERLRKNLNPLSTVQDA
jgi:hypothetical protein